MTGSSEQGTLRPRGNRVLLWIAVLCLAAGVGIGLQQVGAGAAVTGAPAAAAQLIQANSCEVGEADAQGNALVTCSIKLPTATQTVTVTQTVTETKTVTSPPTTVTTTVTVPGSATPTTSTPAPTTPAPTTPAPTTPAPTTPAPTTPAPTTPPPSPSPTAVGPCWSKPSACGYPDATNTGVKKAFTATRMSDWTVTQAGTVIDGWDIKGCLYIRAANVIVRNSRIACNNDNVIDVRGPNGATVVPNANLLVEDSDIIVSGYGNNGISWTGYTLRRVHITATGSDCASANEGVVIEDSFCEIIGKVRSDPVTTLPGSPHPDGFQETGSSRNVTIRHNTISNPFMVVSAIMQDGGTSNIRIVNNLVAGGGYTLYCPANRSALVEFSGNVVSRVYNPNGGTWGANYRDQCPNSGWRWDT